MEIPNVPLISHFKVIAHRKHFIGAVLTGAGGGGGSGKSVDPAYKNYGGPAGGGGISSHPAFATHSELIGYVLDVNDAFKIPGMISCRKSMKDGLDAFHSIHTPIEGISSVEFVPVEYEL